MKFDFNHEHDEAVMGYNAVKVLKLKYGNKLTDYDIFNMIKAFYFDRIDEFNFKSRSTDANILNFDNPSALLSGVVLGLYGKEGLKRYYEGNALNTVERLFDKEDSINTVSMRRHGITESLDNKVVYRSENPNGYLRMNNSVEPLKFIDKEFGALVLKSILDGMNSSLSPVDIFKHFESEVVVNSLINFYEDESTSDELKMYKDNAFGRLAKGTVLSRYGRNTRIFTFIPPESVYIVLNSDWILTLERVIASLINHIRKIILKYDPDQEVNIADVTLNSHSQNIELYSELLDYVNSCFYGELTQPEVLDKYTSDLDGSKDVDLVDMHTTVEDVRGLNVNEKYYFFRKFSPEYFERDNIMSSIMNEEDNLLETLDRLFHTGYLREYMGLETDEEVLLQYTYLQYLLFNGTKDYVYGGEDNILELDELGFLGMYESKSGVGNPKHTDISRGPEIGGIDRLFKIIPSLKSVNEKGLGYIQDYINENFNINGESKLGFNDLKSWGFVVDNPNKDLYSVVVDNEFDDNIVKSLFKTIFDNTEMVGAKSTLSTVKSILEPLLYPYVKDGTLKGINKKYYVLSDRQVQEIIIPMLDDYPRLRKEYRKLYMKKSL